MAQPLLLPVEENVELRIAARSGRVVVRAESRADIAVVSGQERLKVAHDESGALTLSTGNGGSQSIELRCPPGTRVTIGTSSGAVELVGRLGVVSVTSDHGRITVEHAAAAAHAPSAPGPRHPPPHNRGAITPVGS